MTWQWTKSPEEVDADIPKNINGAASTQAQAAQDGGRALAPCEGSKGLQEMAEAASPPFSMLKKSHAAWPVRSLRMLFLVVVLSVVRGGPLQAPREPRAATTDTADWIELLPQDVVRHMDTQVDPCDDLYAFSCGSWLKQAKVPGERLSASLFSSAIRDENEKVLKEVMQQGWPLVGELYDSCMNFSDTSSATADAASVAFLSPAIKQIAATTSKSELFQLAGTLSRAGPSFLTGLGVSADAREATTYALYASQTGLSLPVPEYYLDPKLFDSISNAFHAYVAKLFSLVGWEAHEAASQASLVIAFEQTLAKLFVSDKDPVASYNRMSVAEAAKKYPLLFAHFVGGTGTLENLIARNASVIVQTPLFFERVEELVTGDSVTLDILKAVLTYQYISDQVKVLSEPFVQASYSFHAQTLRGQKKRAPRSTVCLQRVTKHFPDLVGKYFARHRFDEAIERLANQLVTQIQASFEKDLTHVDWLDEPTRQGALDKLGKMASLVGYSKSCEDYPFKLHGDALLAENIRTIREHDFHRDTARIDGRVDRNKWTETGAAVNAFYFPMANQIVVPAGILQPPNFAREQHPARNFGAIGSLIGHEMTHGFDAYGKSFNGDGNLQDWWSNDTAMEFSQRADCLVKQYNDSAVMSSANPDKVLGYVDGELTLSENIADNGGLELSFDAYRTYIAKQTMVNVGEATPVSNSRADSTLPADVADKLFFISFAQRRCIKMSDASMIESLVTDTHSPNQWRVNGVASNSDDFARVFSCPAGSPMNPTKKCKLW